MKRTIFSALALLGLAAGSAHAQYAAGPFSVEARVGLALPLGDIADANWGTGWGAEVGARYRLTPTLSLYGAYDYYEFGDESEVVEATLIDQGFAGGAQLTGAGLLAGIGAPWVRAGAIYNEVEMKVGEASVEGEPELGFEVGGGLIVPLGNTLTVTPGVRYRRHDITLEPLQGLQLDAGTIEYLSAGVGLSLRF